MNKDLGALNAIRNGNGASGVNNGVNHNFINNNINININHNFTPSSANNQGQVKEGENGKIIINTA